MEYYALLEYFQNIIHYNTDLHGFTEDFRMYPHSSYGIFLAPKKTRLARSEILNWYGNVEHFKHCHDQATSFNLNEDWIIEFD